MSIFIENCVTFCAILGFPVYERRCKKYLKWKKCTNLLSLAYNLLIVATVIWSFYFGNAFFAETSGNKVNSAVNYFEHYSSKPLLVMLMQINFCYNYPLNYPVMQVYYLFTGPKLVKLLQSKYFHQVYSKKEKHTFAFLLMFMNFLFLSSYYQILAYYCRFESWWTTVVNLASTYISSVATFLPVGVLYYTLYGTICFLDKILRNLIAENQGLQQKVTADDLTIFKQISVVAKINKRIYRLISLPLTLFLFSQSLDTVVTICIVREKIYGLLVYILIVSALLVYASFLGERVQLLLGNIVTEYLRTIRTKEKVIIYESLEAQLSQLESVYGRQLEVRLFSVVEIDSQTVLKLFLFLLNFSILIQQTK